MSDIVIVSAARTPVGSFMGAFTDVPAHDLGAAVIQAVMSKANIQPDEVNEIVMGQVLSAGQGQNPVRQAAIKAGIPFEKTAYQINQLCGSGLRSVAIAMQSIELKDADIMIAGGMENMSQSPHVANLRKSHKMGDFKMRDSMIEDGLFCAINGYHMGITAENIAKKWGFSREQQDEFACRSQNRAEAAIKKGLFKDEIVPVSVQNKKETYFVSDDEYPKFSCKYDDLKKLRPAFSKDGTVTAGNASGINDGAAAVLLMRQDEADKRGLTPMARICSWATAGIDPAFMGCGPIPASRRALQKAGWRMDDVDLIEANEAFAAQTLAVAHELSLNNDKVNVNGGAIALGHPIGASGARILVTLLHEMQRRDSKRGLATLCIGGGMGISMCLMRD